MKRTRFIAGLGCVAFGAAIFAVAFRAALVFVYRSVFRADDVVTAITGLGWEITLEGRRLTSDRERGAESPSFEPFR